MELNKEIQKIELNYFLLNKIKKDNNTPKILLKILEARINNNKVWIDYKEIKESLGFSKNEKLNEAI